MTVGTFNWVGDVGRMQAKMGLPGAVRGMSPGALREYWQFRLRLVREEAGELLRAAAPEDAVDALVDLCVVAIGALTSMGVDAHRAWDAVMAANMAKEPGAKPGRDSPPGAVDMVKPPGWRPPCHQGNVGRVREVYEANGAPEGGGSG